MLDVPPGPMTYHEGMSKNLGKEIWFRNPHNYVKELAEQNGPFNIAWDRGVLVKRRIDPRAHGLLYFGVNTPFRAVCIGEQGAAEVTRDHGLDNPKAVYPVWQYGDDFDDLVEMCGSNIADQYDTTSDEDIPVDERPVPGQEHRIVISGVPDARMMHGKAFFRQLDELQEEYPDVIIHVHGVYGFQTLFNKSFRSIDWEPRTDAASGSIVLGNGKRMAYAQAAVNSQQWVNLNNMSITDLKVPRNRCMFNIRSYKWAAENWDENIKFQSKARPKTRLNPDTGKREKIKYEVDTISPDSQYMIPTTRSARARRTLANSLTDEDKVVCDSCSLNLTCKYFRVGSVCTLPGSDSSPLVNMFNSRDASKIIDGLGAIVGAQVTRLERGMMYEEDDDAGLSAEVTSLMNSVFNNGVKLAKLIDPSLTKPTVQINNGVSGSSALLANADPKKITAEVVRAFENQGIRRADITPEMFQSMLQQMAGAAPQTQQPKQIEGTVVNE